MRRSVCQAAQFEAVQDFSMDLEQLDSAIDLAIGVLRRTTQF